MMRDVKTNTSATIQRASNYNIYEIEYHPLYAMYQFLTLFDHCNNLAQLLPLYALAEQKIQTMIKQGVVKPCPLPLRHCFSISAEIKKNLHYLTEFLAVDQPVKVLSEATKDYLRYLDQMECPYLLFGNYMALLGLNFYGGTYAVKPALSRICKEINDAEGTSAFPVISVNGAERVNDWVKQWINTTSPSGEWRVILGYRNAIHHLKNICDKILDQSPNRDLVISLDAKAGNESIRQQAKKDDLLVQLEYVANCGQHREAFRKKGYSCVMAQDSEKTSYGESGWESKLEDLSEDALLLNITEQNRVRASWMRDGKKQKKEFQDLMIHEARDESDIENTEKMVFALVSRLPERKRSGTGFFATTGSNRFIGRMLLLTLLIMVVMAGRMHTDVQQSRQAYR